LKIFRQFLSAICAVILFFSAILNADVIIEDFDEYQDTAELLTQWGGDISLDKYHSMEWAYDNSVYHLSETAKYFDPSLDLTNGGYTALAVDLQGNAANDNQVMYFFVVDDANIAQIECPIADCLTNDSWQTWIIPFYKFTEQGVDLTSVSTIAFWIGDGISSAGSGTLIIDDIRLIDYQCIGQNAPKGDVNGDCKVDANDLNILAGDWLASDYAVDSIEPNSNSILAYYSFDETSGLTASDSSLNENDADIETSDSNGLWNAAGHNNGCIYLAGDSAVIIPSDVFAAVTDQLTISMWIRGDGNDFSDKLNIVEAACGQPGWQNNAWQAASWQVESASDYNVWNHYAVTIDAGTDMIQIYLNGILVSRSEGGEIVLDGIGAGDTIIGASVYEGISDSWIKLDELKIYDTALSQAQIVYLASGASSQVIQPIAPVLTSTDMDSNGKIDFDDFAKIALDWLQEKWWN
jgi:hypothetical protein